MSESPLAARIARALADRRPSPSSDFAARLERACEQPPRSLTAPLLAAAVATCAILIVIVARPEPDARLDPAVRAVLPAQSPPPTPSLPHDGRYSTNQCGQCHRSAPTPPAAHQVNGAFPLVGSHRAVACATCHTAGKAPQRACVSCHADPHRGVRTNQCTSCHTQESWKPK